VYIDYGESIFSGESNLNLLGVTCDSVWAAWWRDSSDLYMLFALTAGFLYKRRIMIVYVCWYEFENNDTSEPSVGHMEHYCNQLNIWHNTAKPVNPLEPQVQLINLKINFLPHGKHTKDLTA
jgi:hypothetical protein